MRSLFPLVLCVALAAGAAACRGGEEEAAEEPAEAEGLVVPDSTILREVTSRFDADPRLDTAEIQLEPHVTNGEVTLVGVVPSRFELAIAREVAISTPGVKQVWLDSVRVLSEQPEEGQPADTASVDRS